MISKLVVWAPDRVRALKKLSSCLNEYMIVGLPNNIPFLLRCLNHPAFFKGQVETGFIPQYTDELIPQSIKPSFNTIALAILSLLLREKEGDTLSQLVSNYDRNSPWNMSSNFRLNVPNDRKVSLGYIDASTDAEHTIECIVTYLRDKSYLVKFDSGEELHMSGTIDNTGKVSANINGQRSLGTVLPHNLEISVFEEGKESHQIFSLPEDNYNSVSSGPTGPISPMAGQIVKVNVEVGQQVSAGESLVVMEAMKMEYIITASMDGFVQKVLFPEGSFVEGGKTVVELVEELKENS